MIRRIEWREVTSTHEDPRWGYIAKVNVHWDVTWVGETSEESGGESFRDMAESVAYIAKLRPSDDYRLEGSTELGHFTMRFNDLSRRIEAEAARQKAHPPSSMQGDIGPQHPNYREEL